jgi:hypothetical protein
LLDRSILVQDHEREDLGREEKHPHENLSSLTVRHGFSFFSMAQISQYVKRPIFSLGSSALMGVMQRAHTSALLCVPTSSS